MTDQEIRIECIKAACLFCADRVVEVGAPLAKAQEFYGWVVGGGVALGAILGREPVTIRSIRRRRMKGGMA